MRTYQAPTEPAIPFSRQELWLARETLTKAWHAFDPVAQRASYRCTGDDPDPAAKEEAERLTALGYGAANAALKMSAARMGRLYDLSADAPDGTVPVSEMLAQIAVAALCDAFGSFEPDDYKTARTLVDRIIG